MASERKENADRKRKNPLGLILLAVAITAIVVGAAVGGGLGSRLKDAQDKARQW